MLNAVVGFAGLAPTMWALERGVTLALANKESLVAAGELALAARERGGGELIPVDSEHSALFQCAQLGEPESLVLTASGGPFRGRTRDELAGVTPEEALAHPTWSMGPKITIDSATLANKGLEVIEAHFLFGVAVRPDRGRDPPDLDRPRARPLPRRRRDRAPRLPRHARPDLLRADLPGARRDAGARRSSCARSSSTSRTTRRSACSPLAREAGERGGTYPCAYNAANEVAVQAFLEGRIGFLEIAALVEDVLGRVDGSPARDLDELVEADRRARDLVAVAAS